MWITCLRQELRLQKLLCHSPSRGVRQLLVASSKTFGLELQDSWRDHQTCFDLRLRKLSGESRGRGVHISYRVNGLETMLELGVSGELAKRFFF